MADIKDQLIKDSYNYVLQSDIVEGIVYRIGGSIPVNPKFLSGLTINSGFKYSNGTEQDGYVLISDSQGNANWFPSTGLTISGLTYYVQSTLPPGTGYTNGDRWFDTSTGDELVWIIDNPPLPGTWVQPNNGGGGGGSGGSTLSGSGTTNYLAVWGSQTTLSSSTIYYDGTNYNIPSLSAGTITSQNYQGNLVNSLTNGDSFLSVNNTTGNILIYNTKPDVDVVLSNGGGIGIGGIYPNFTLTNTDKGSDQNIFKNIKIDNDTKFSASSNSSDLNFSGIGVTITSASNNTLVFSAGTSSQSVSGDYLPLSGGTVTGNTIFQSGVTSNTVSATTYFNLPVSGLTSGSGIGITNNNNNFTISYTGSTGISGDYLPLSGGTLTGGTIFQSGLTANTISATTYYNLPPIYQLTGGTYSSGTIDFKNTTGGTSFSVTGLSKYFVTGSTPMNVTLNNGDRWFDTNSGIEVVWITDVDGSQWIQPSQGGGSASGNYLPLSGGTVTGGTIFQSGLSANTISATTYYNLPISGVTDGNGITTLITNGNLEITNSNPDQTVAFPSQDGLSVTGTYPNFDITNTDKGSDQYIFKNIQINTNTQFSAGSNTDNLNFSGIGINITSSSNNTLVFSAGTSPQSVSGDYLPLSGGTVSGTTNFTSGLTANTISATSMTSTTLSVTSSAITFSNLSFTNNKRILTADNLGRVTQFANITGLYPGSDPQVQSAIIQLPKEIRYGSAHDVYNLKARVVIPGGTNVYINYIGTLTNNTGLSFIPTATSGLIDAADPTFKQVQSSLTTGGLVYDETLLFAAPVDLITVNYDNSTTANVYDIFLIAGNTNNFSCVVWVDYEFMVPQGDNITFTN